MKKKTQFICVVLLLIWGVCDSRRSGGSRPSSRPSHSYSRPSPSRPSYSSPSRPSYSSPSRPSYSSPSRPSYSLPSRPSYPSYSRPSYSPPSYSRPSYSSPSYSFPSPSVPSPSISRPSASRPSYSTPQPVGPPKANIGWNLPAKQSAKGSRPSYPSYKHPAPNAKPAPLGPPLTSKPLHNSGKTHDSILTSKKTPTLGNAPQGPPKPSYTQGTFQGPPSYPKQTYHPSHSYPPAYSGHGYPPPAYPGHYPSSHHPGSNVIINNNNIVHGPTYHSTPGWSYGYPSYHYGNSDTGSTSLGFYLGYTLGRIRNPTYHYSYNSYDGYRPRYDHYTVHHYYHNNNDRIIERERIIEPNTVVGCVGDSGSICPANTRSLCTENGVIMCVASVSATVPCKDEKDTNCVQSTIPCVNSKAPECNNNAENVTTVSIPCISTAKINGTVTYVNNTIIVDNFNSSRPTRSVDNATELTTPYPITTSSTTNVTTTTMTTTPMTTSSTINISTTADPITISSPTLNLTTTPITIPNSTTSVDITASTTSVLLTTPKPKITKPRKKYEESEEELLTTPKPKRTKSEEPQNFCVTIMAVPRERKPTEGEELYDNIENVVENFMTKAFGL